MFFIASKIFWMLANPASLLALLLAAALIAFALGRRRIGVGATGLAFVVVFVSCFTSIGALALGILENRFARPDPPPAIVAGIVVLGGGLEGAVNEARGGYEMNSSGDRFVETAVLALRYPDAKVLISGGSGALLLDGEADAQAAPRMLAALGIDASRLMIEDQSRNTHENAEFSRRMADPKPGDTWLLVTSAFHMPRSLALFRKAGFAVVPWPTDYRTSGRESIGLAQDNPVDTLQATSLAIREWIGLLAYWVTGRIDSPFPAP